MMPRAADLDAVCEHHLHTLLTQQPHGPYYLLGYSLGGTLAQGIAARLRQRGEAVAFLGLARYLAAGDAELGGERGERSGS